MQHLSLGAWIDVRRHNTPDRTAIITPDGDVLSYGRFAELVDGVAELLRSRGVEPRQRVAFLGENSPGFLAALFGAVRVGAVFVPINTRLAAPEVAHVLADSAAGVLIHDAGFDELLRSVTVGAERRIRLDELTGARPAATGTPVGAHPSGGDDPAAIIYTSGTTGRPKGAVLSHANLSWAALNTIIDYDVHSTEVALMISPLFHVASLGMGALPVFLKGGTLVLERGFDPGRALAAIERHRVTMVSGVPTTFQLMADHPDWASTDLSSLTKLTCGGSAVPGRILNAYEDRGLAFSQGYGMTETSPGATSLPPAATLAKQGSVGLPHFFTRVRIADGAGGGAPAGTPGEIEIFGPNVFSGYLSRPEETAASFTPDGWFRSGDIGWLDVDGYLFISDRLKDMIISGGENIYPAEVEQLIADIDGVTGVAVIGVPDLRWGEVPVAVLTVREGMRPDVADIARRLEGRVARYKIPKRVEFVPELPRTASGKVRKAELRARFGDG